MRLAGYLYLVQSFLEGYGGVALGKLAIGTAVASLAPFFSEERPVFFHIEACGDVVRQHSHLAARQPLGGHKVGGEYLVSA